MAVSTSAPAAPMGPPDHVGASAARHPARLTLCLVVLCGYAAFASGATRYPQLTWVSVLAALLALAGVASWAVGGGVRWGSGRGALVGLGLLAGLAAWTSLSVVWSIAPDRSWLEANRTIAYTLVAALAVAAGASDARAIERASLGVLGVAVLAALYGLATKTLPGVSVPGLFDLDQAEGVSRLRVPLGYWNATALLCALGVPVALTVACDRGRAVRARTAAAVAGLPLLCVIGLTYSRGGVVAVLVATAVLVAAGGARLRGPGLLLLLGVACAPVLAVAFSLPGVSDDLADAATRQRDGAILLGTFLVAAAVLAGAMRVLIGRERRVQWTAERSRRVGRVAVTLCSVLILAGVVGLAVSERGLPGAVSDQVSAFTEPSTDSVGDPGRLASTTSGNRWTWWQEALGAWSDRPVAGWGAGSFAALHLRYRDDELPVTQAHSVPLQLLAETGVIGLTLFLAAMGALGLAAVSTVRRLGGSERALAAAALGAVVAWGTHGLYDWDWNVPGVTLPALLLLGVLAGTGARTSARAVVPVAVVPVAAGVAALVVVCAVLPAWADGKASAAQVAARSGASADELQRAAASAELAARLDPVSIRPLLAASAIARRRGRPLEARRVLLEAVGRQPESVSAWLNLAATSFELADRAGFERAAVRALALDPRSPRTRTVALAAVAYRAPTGASATAVGTPLTPAPVAAPVVP